MAWFKVTSDKLSRRLDDPNNRNTYEEYEYFTRGEVLELDKDGREAKRYLKMGAVQVASNEEAKAAQEAKEAQEQREIDAAQEQLKAQQEYLEQLEVDRLGPPGERQFQPKLHEARTKIAEDLAKQRAADADAARKATASAKKTAPAQGGDTGQSGQGQNK